MSLAPHEIAHLDQGHVLVKRTPRYSLILFWLTSGYTKR